MFWYSGSIEAATPMMLEMVAVGAMATQLELRMPCSLMRARSASSPCADDSSMST